MRPLLPVLAIVLGSVSLSAADGLLAYEGFDYPVGDVTSLNGGSGWQGGWKEASNEVAAVDLTSALGQTPATSGAALRLVRPDWASQRTLAAPLCDHAGTWYMSFLIRNDGGVPENYSQIQLNATAGGDGVGFGKSWMNDKWVLNAGGEHASNSPCGTPEAVFVVLKFVCTDGAKGDKVQAYIDPDLPKEPAVADIEGTGLDIPPLTVLTCRAKKTTVVDELRLGTTWAAVCPAK